MSEEKVGTGWFFTRCHRCNGHSLVRRAEVNLIKVDRTPPGEHILMTEPASKHTPLLGDEATQKLAEYIRSGRNPNVVHLGPQTDGKAAPQAAPIPAPMPELEPAQQKTRIWRKFSFKKLVPYMMGAAGLIAIASGVYLFIGIRTLTRTPTKAHSESAQLDRESVREIAHPTSDSTATHAAAPRPADGAATAAAAAAAPEPKNDSKAETAAQNTPKMWIKVRSEGANVFGGPGLSYPIVGTISSGTRYEVLDWSDRWFKVRAGEKQETAGWVRNDLVQFVQ